MLVMGGVGYEKCIVTGEVFQCISSPEKFVPILRSGNEKDSIPSYLKHKVFVDFRDDHVFQRSLEDLLRHFHDIPRYVRPGIGSKPSLNNRKNVSIESYKGNRYCSYCGALPGQKSSCTTLMGFHNFVSGKGNMYCSYCGVLPGQKSSCTTLSGFHNFVLDQ